MKSVTANFKEESFFKQNSGVKTIFTQFNKIVFLNHIRSIEISDEEKYRTEDVGGVILAEMNTGDTIVLAEYEEFSTCEDLIRSITAWASEEPLDAEDNVFVLWHDWDFKDKIQDLIEKYPTTY